MTGSQFITKPLFSDFEENKKYINVEVLVLDTIQYLFEAVDIF